MKKIIITALSFLAISCHPVTQGARNAEQFVASHFEADEIESMETEPADSLMSDAALNTAYNAALKAKADYLAGTITREQYDAAQVNYSKVIDSFSLSWAVHKSPKESETRRKTYKVTVKTKSHAPAEIYVCMDKDGQTPAISDFEIQAISDQQTNQSINCLLD